jgi:hypothetical protein
MSEQQWHLDKRVPIALILAIAIQSGSAIWWASTIQARVGVNEANIAKLDTVVEGQRNASQVQAIQLGRIEEQIGALRSDIGRLVTAIERAGR